MAPSKGFSADPTLPGCGWRCSFTQPWPWCSLRILGTFSHASRARSVYVIVIGPQTRYQTQKQWRDSLPFPISFTHPTSVFLAPWPARMFHSLVSRQTLTQSLDLVLFSLPQCVSSLEAPESVVRNGHWSKAGQSSYMRFTVETHRGRVI